MNGSAAFSASRERANALGRMKKVYFLNYFYKNYSERVAADGM
jgi:hypothetical protein